MTRTLNLLAALLLGLFVTLSLFFLMQYLITGSDETPRPGERRFIGDISIPEIVIEPRTEIPRPLEPVAPEEPPPLPEFDNTPGQPTAPTLTAGIVEPTVGITLDDPLITRNDADFMPIVTVPAQYPQRALQQDIEGWCLVSFTVDEKGAVVDPVVLDAEPAGYFENASLRAVSRFKFNPRVQDGAPVRTTGVQYVFTYRLADE